MEIPFIKMFGSGNDFLVIDGPVPAATLNSAAVRRLANRRTGVGFDQLLQILPGASPEPGQAASPVANYRIFNADGGEVEQCGNGARCIARIVAERLQLAGDFVLGSPAGPVAARLLGPDRATVSMGVPIFRPGAIPFDAAAEDTQYPLELDGTVLEVAALSMGNPHCVLQVPDVALADLAGIGPRIEHHPRFPRHTNVGFMAVLSRREIALRVHERGVGETQACGTGACAAVVAGRQLGLLDEEVIVNLPGGQLMVNWAGADSDVWLTGEAGIAYRGSINL